RHFPDGEQMTIYDAAMRYQAEGVPLMIIAGKEYGTGSSRDWAAKGTSLLGIRAVLAESYERIHRSNLVGMGVLPLQFRAGETSPGGRAAGPAAGGSTAGAPGALSPGGPLTVRCTRPDGSLLQIETVVRIDSAVEVDYYRNGGILQTVIRGIAAS